MTGNPTAAAPFASPLERTQTLDAIVGIIDKRYAVPAEGEALVNELRVRIARGDYDDLNTLGDFAERLTADLKAISNDDHMALAFRGETRARPAPKTMQEEMEEDADELECYSSDPGMIAMGKTFDFLNQGVVEFRMLPGGIAYVNLKAFSFCTSAAQVYAGLFNLISGCRGLIVDLRENSGGSSAADLFLSYLHKPSRRKTVSITTRYTGQKQTFNMTPNLAGPRYDDPNKGVWILIGNYTFSAAEHFALTARALGRARLVGETTGGGGRGCAGYWVHENLDLCCSIQEARCEIDGSTWERTGVSPHFACKAEDALDVALCEALEKVVPELEANPVLKHMASGRAAKVFGRDTLNELRIKLGKDVGEAGPVAGTSGRSLKL
ncbi:hypothetical protein HDU86_000942 [Geranomyces michiganensis]|nr:hypothetical protein HDU86_000942 [Geranomyces michiganensis]